MAFVLETVLLLGVVAYLLYRLGTRNHDYWKKRGVPCPKPVPFFGTNKDIILSRVPFIEFFNRIYNEFPNSPFVGLLTASNPTFLVRDPELIKHILTKDFEFFPDRGTPYDEKLNPLSAHLFNIEGVRWKNLRIKMTPAFTSGKIKRMFPLMLECGQELGTVLKDSASRGESVEFKDILGRFSTDVIGTCAFGVTCNSLKDPNAEFRQQGMKIFKVTLKTLLRSAVFSAFPQSRLINLFFRDASLEEFFMRITSENIAFREKESTKRGDLLDLLIELKHKGRIVDANVDVIEDPFLKVPVSTSSDELKFSDNLLAAQAFVFFIAGFETSSSTMSFCLIELAHYPEIQTKVQHEIDSVLKRHKGEITYEALAEMTYLDKVVAETLRKYPPLAMLTRRNNKPYQFPDTKFTLEAKTRVFIPAFALHYDPAIYPEPQRFDPERFSNESKASRHHYTYLPFGEGPRICIGMRFGLLQTKLGLVSVLSRYSVEPNSLTQYPVKFKKGAFITASEGGCDLAIKERTLASTH